MGINSAIKAYSQIDIQGSIIDATPHRVIQILLENALDRLRKAKVFMSEKNIHDKGLYISMGITIIDGLRMSLDKDQGGDIADNLDGLYEYMNKTLLEANLNNDPSKLDEVIGLLVTIKEGWDQIPDEYHDKVEHE